VNRTPTPAKTLSHIVTYSSIIPGAAGSVICPVTIDPRYNRRAIPSRNVAGSMDLSGGTSIRPFYTTQPVGVAGSCGNCRFAGVSADDRAVNQNLKD
jgi:hypothetical protein